MINKTVNGRVCKNVKALCIMRNVKLGELEKDLGKQPGFFSRNHTVSPDMIIAIADYFQLTADELMKCDFESELDEYNERKALNDAIRSLSKRWSKDELAKWALHVINIVYGGNTDA